MIAVVGIVIDRRAAAGAGFASAVLRITILTPCAARIGMRTIVRGAVSAGTAGSRSAVLTVRIIAPGAITHAVRSVVVVRRAAVSARACASVLTGRILLPASITVTMAARVDGFALGLTAGARIASVTIAGAGRCLLALQYPCMAAAVRASAGTVAASAVALIGVSAKVLDVVAGVTLVIVCMTARGMCDFNVCALERILSA